MQGEHAGIVARGGQGLQSAAIGRRRQCALSGFAATLPAARGLNACAPW